MSAPVVAFTKLIVADEEAMATYYGAVYGLVPVHRVSGDDSGTGAGGFREVILGREGAMGLGSLILFRLVDQPPPRDREVIVGFVTDDLDALAACIADHGGAALGAIRDMPEQGVRVLFATDPEGRMSENVQML